MNAVIRLIVNTERAFREFYFDHRVWDRDMLNLEQEARQEVDAALQDDPLFDNYDLIPGDDPTSVIAFPNDMLVDPVLPVIYVIDEIEGEEEPHKIYRTLLRAGLDPDYAQSLIDLVMKYHRIESRDEIYEETSVEDIADREKRVLRRTLSSSKGRKHSTLLDDVRAYANDLYYPFDQVYREQLAGYARRLGWRS